VRQSEECQIQAAQILNAISAKFIAGKGVQRYRDFQDDLMRNSMIIVTSGILTYDKLIEKIQGLEEFIGEHGGNESEQLDPQERLKEWLNGSGEAIQ
jgi:hypothetical protein